MGRERVRERERKRENASAGRVADHSRLGGKTVWPSGLRRWLQAPVRKGVGSNPTGVIQIWTGAEKMRSAREGEIARDTNTRPTQDSIHKTALTRQLTQIHFLRASSDRIR